jgi:hypothetical protein
MLETLNTGEESSYIVTDKKPYTVFQDSENSSKRLVVKDKTLDVGYCKHTVVYTKIRYNSVDGILKTKYKEEIYINDKFIQESFFSCFPIISINNHSKNNIKHPFLYYQSLFRTKRDLVRLQSQFLSNFSTASSLNLNGTLLINKDLLSNKTIKNSELRENILEISSEKIADPDYLPLSWSGCPFRKFIRQCDIQLF